MTSGARPDSPGATYRARLDRFRDAAGEEAGRASRLSRVRGVLFLLGVGLLTGAEVTGDPLATGLLVAGILSLAGFAEAVKRHRRARAEVSRLREMAGLNERALARLGREWEALPDVHADPVDPSHPYAADLTVTGERSLLRLCTDVVTRPGRDTLRAWLLEPAPTDRVPLRQEAVAELAPRLDFRQDLAIRGRAAGGPDSEPVDGLVAWGEEPSPWSPPGWLVAASWALPPISLGLLGAHLAGMTALPWWLAPVAAAWAAVGFRSRELEARMDRVGSGAERLGRYAELLAILSGLDADAPLLRELRDAVRSEGKSAADQLRRLERRVAWSEVRRNDLMHLPLQVLLLWDVHVVRSLESWRRRSGDSLSSWLEAVGALEALCALATLRADHPDWCFPEVGGGTDRLAAEALGHPLLPGERCVRNDVEVGPAGTFLFVTGSNMAGKSTLLRALGINTVLARAGGPACARTLRLPRLRVHTSMRVEESLSEGISYFMAELHRVRGVVDAARRADEGGSEGVLYLLDEPLQGTNEAERRVAVQTIVGHLLRTSAIGAVATHDLRLHATDLLDEAADPVHLEGTVRDEEDGPVLSFDYRLRPGLATSSNALALLRAVGLGTEEESPSGDPGEARADRDRHREDPGEDRG